MLTRAATTPGSRCSTDSISQMQAAQCSPSTMRSIAAIPSSRRVKESNSTAAASASGRRARTEASTRRRA
jgi:hypothetical protein